MCEKANNYIDLERKLEIGTEFTKKDVEVLNIKVRVTKKNKEYSI